MKKYIILLLLIDAVISNAQTVSITSSPSGVICPGTSVTFTASTTGITTPSYQWYKNNIAISGATASTYSTTTLSNNDVIKVSVGDLNEVVTNSLIQNLDVNNSSSYSTGNTWTDLTGNGNNGTITVNTGSITSTTVGNIKSFNFTKGLNYISAPVAKSPSMTFNVWAKTSSLANYSSGTMLFNAGRSGTTAFDGGPDLFIVNNKLQWNTYDITNNIFKSVGTTTDLTTTLASINDLNWHLFTVVVDEAANITNLYIDGVLKGTANYKSPNLHNTTALYIGSEGVNGSVTGYNTGWAGNISIFQSYSRALSSTEVVQNFNAKANFFGVNSAALRTSNNITITVNSAPSAPITVTGDGCVNRTTLATTSGLSSYAWYLDNVSIAGATSNTFSPKTSGQYSVLVSNGVCSSISSATTINTCGVTADGKMMSIAVSAPFVSAEGGKNLGAGIDDSGKIINTTSFTTTATVVDSTSLNLGISISVINGTASSVGVIYSTNANFDTFTTATIQSNVNLSGNYLTTISGLSIGTTYYVKSFIINNAGTTYGNVVSITTPP